MTWAQFTLYFGEYWSTITFCVSALFILYYGLAAPWYKLPFGRALMIVDAGLAVATLPTALNFLFNVNVFDNRVMAWVIIVMAGMIPFAIGYRIIALWRIRNTKFWSTFRKKTSPSQPTQQTDSDTEYTPEV